MTIASILARKGVHVVSVGPGEDAMSVAATLSQHRIGAVMVREGATVLGILSERDIVRAIGKSGTAALSMTARQMMTTEVHSVTPETSINEALGEMTDRRIRHLPVMTGTTLAGMVSIGDLVKARMDAIIEEAESLRAFVTAS